MNKQIFLTRLREAMSGFPQEDVAERLAFYNEIIDDKMEEGLSEEAAVAELGSVEDIVSQIMAETPLSRLVKEKIKPKRQLRGWEIVLLILGFPLWFPLLMASFGILFSVYVVIWAVVISLWAVGVSFLACSAGSFIAGLALVFSGNTTLGLVLVSVGLMFTGFSIFMFFGCIAATKCAVYLTKKVALGIKSLFIRKEKK